MNKDKMIIDNPGIKDNTELSITTRNIIPNKRSFCEEDKEYWVKKIKAAKQAVKTDQENKNKKNVDSVNKK
jgi:hypothetical protein